MYHVVGREYGSLFIVIIKRESEPKCRMGGIATPTNIHINFVNSSIIKNIINFIVEDLFDLKMHIHILSTLVFLCRFAGPVPRSWCYPAFT